MKPPAPELGGWESYRPRLGLGEGPRRSASWLKTCWTAEKSFCTASLPLWARSSSADWPSLIPGRVLCGFGDLVIEGLQAGEVWVAAHGRWGRQGGAGLGVIGDGAGRLVISSGESFVVGKDGVELLAQILELAAGAHFGEDGLHAAIVFGGVADFVEDSSRLLLLKRLQGGDDACGGLCGALNLFGVTLRLQAFGGERGQFVPEAAGRRGWVCRRRGSVEAGAAARF